MKCYIYGGLGLKQARTAASAAFITSCNATRQLSFCLFSCASAFDTLCSSNITQDDTSSPLLFSEEKEEARAEYCNLLADFGQDPPKNLSSTSQKALQSQVDCSLSSSLKDSFSLGINLV